MKYADGNITYALLPDQDPLNCSGPTMLFPPAMTSLLSPVAPPDCYCGSGVSLPSTMPSQNPHRHRSCFPAESFPPLWHPHRSPSPTLHQRACCVGPSIHAVSGKGPLVSRAVPGASSLYSSSLPPLSAQRCSDALPQACIR